MIHFVFSISNSSKRSNFSFCSEIFFVDQFQLISCALKSLVAAISLYHLSCTNEQIDLILRISALRVLENKDLRWRFLDLIKLLLKEKKKRNLLERISLIYSRKNDSSFYHLITSLFFVFFLSIRLMFRLSFFTSLSQFVSILFDSRFREFNAFNYSFLLRIYSWSSWSHLSIASIFSQNYLFLSTFHFQRLIRFFSDISSFVSSMI